MSEKLSSHPIIQRYANNPILSAEDIPYHATLVFNAGVAKYQGQYVMVFRNDFGQKNNPSFQGTSLGLAFSQDGVHWNAQPQPCWPLTDVIHSAHSLFKSKDAEQEIIRAYDPRLTVLDGACYICFALDTKHGLRGGIARTQDFYHYEIACLSAPDNRNMVLFPEKIGGKYVRLERPMPVYSRGGRDRFDLWMSDSPDLRYWGNSQCLLGVEEVAFANDKIGPGAPPVRTTEGWLALFHAVDIDRSRGKNGWEASWQKRYSAGVMLLDLEDPSRVKGICKTPLLAPEAAYEVEGGFRNQVIFPGGMILEESGEVKIYYGAADTVECLATANVDDLVKICIER